MLILYDLTRLTASICQIKRNGYAAVKQRKDLLYPVVIIKAFYKKSIPPFLTETKMNV
jgi:hypothetical protein